MRVAFKFCGGCDPAYERVEYWEAIREAAGERISWQTTGQGGGEVLLLICGCERACPLEDLPAGRPVVIVKNNRQAPAGVMARLLGQGS
ncbi:MAG: hypothetical protein KKH47_16550 [Proteobacteria bacterium]|nr:hypothetical protein [Pseudomonadota bacterium]